MGENSPLLFCDPAKIMTQPKKLFKIAWIFELKLDFGTWEVEGKNAMF